MIDPDHPRVESVDGTCLGDFANIVMGQSPSGDTVSSEHGLALLNGPTEFGAHHPTPVQFTTDARKCARPGDILFCVRGSTTGRMNWADQEYAIGRGVAAIRHRQEPALQPFVRGVIEFELSELLAQATGSTFPNISAYQLAEIPYPKLDKAEQRAIAHILSTLDDKIELNRRMNETLEAMARALFKSWFVDFDPIRAKMAGRDPGLPQQLADLFPDRLVDSELGPIPEGWEWATFGDVVEQLRENENPLASPDSIFQHFSIPAFDAGQSPKAEFGQNIKSQKSHVPSGVVLLSKLNPEIERVWFVDVQPDERAVCSTEFLVLRPRPPYGQPYAYCLARSPAFRQELEGLVTGTSKSHQRAQVAAILSLNVVKPADALATSFERAARPLLQRTLECRRESCTLAETRDTLLPKLVSGELAVEGCRAAHRRGQIMTIRPLLFDNMERTDASSKQHNEPLFAYLNRSARREATEIRGRLESWFERFPVEAQHDVRERFRVDDDRAHQGAVFELFMHELLFRLGCTVEVHPVVPGTESRPDFLAHHGDCRFYIEATVVDPKRSLSASRPLEEDVVAKINELTSPHFYIFARVDGKLSRALSREQVIQPFARLLRDHDPDEVQRLIDERGTHAAPFEKIEHGTWSLHGWLRPLPPEKRGYSRPRTLVIGPARSGMIDSSTPVQSAIQKKAKKYGRLDAPLVVAANVIAPFFDQDDEIAVLFGKEQITFFKNRPDLPVKLTRKADGVWIQGGYKPRYTRLAAVLIFRDIAPWNLCDARSCLYVNPDVDYTKLPDVLYRLPHARALETKIPHQYEIQWFEGENIGQLLGVGEDWQTKA